MKEGHHAEIDVLAPHVGTATMQEPNGNPAALLQHHALGKASASRGIFDENKIVGRHGGGHAVSNCEPLLPRPFERGPIMAARMAGPCPIEQHDIAQLGQCARTKRAGFVRMFKFRANLGQHLRHVELAKAIEHDEVARARLRNAIFDFRGLQKGVDGNDGCADARSGEGADDPFDPVGHPKHHAVATLHADARQSGGEIAHALQPLAIGQTPDIARIVRADQRNPRWVQRRRVGERLPQGA